MTNGIGGNGSEITLLENEKRRLSIIRSQILARHSGVIHENINVGSLAHAHLGKEIDDIIEKVIKTAELDGVDIDSEFLDSLQQVSANLYSIEVMWKNTRDIIMSS